jgi:hypothetical protein
MLIQDTNHCAIAPLEKKAFSETGRIFTTFTKNLLTFTTLFFPELEIPNFTTKNLPVLPYFLKLMRKGL